MKSELWEILSFEVVIYFPMSLLRNIASGITWHIFQDSRPNTSLTV